MRASSPSNATRLESASSGITPTRFSGRLVEGERRQRERLGEPFELEFADAITGRPCVDDATCGEGRRRGFLGDLVRPLRGGDYRDDAAL